MFDYRSYRSLKLIDRKKLTKLTAEPFCDCRFPSNMEVNTSTASVVHECCKCSCFYDEDHPRDWSWDGESSNFAKYIDGGKLSFNPEYSEGTQIIRGGKRLEPNMIHYWEIQMVTALTGTDQMIGIGSDKVNLNKHQFNYVSALGEDENSWGFSYKGNKHHKGILEDYGKIASQGCIIGVYVDLFRGYLEYYLNRKSLGIAFHNIPTDPTVKLYPMVCSTASRAAIHLINSTSQRHSLESESMKVLAKNPKFFRKIIEIPGLKKLSEKLWFLMPPKPRYSNRSKKNELSLDDEVVLPTRFKKTCSKDEDFEVNDINDIYTNVEIPEKTQDDITVNDYLLYLL